MFIGSFYIILACFMWGLIFVVPQFMEGYSPIEIALGRYFFYGLMSCIFLLGFRWDVLKRLSRQEITRALWFGLIANVIYYPCLVFSIKYASPVIATLIFGLSPITIALYGNWKQKECSYQSLIIPVLTIIIGLFLVNWPALSSSRLEGSLQQYVLGIFFGIVAVALWTYYAVVNARFLKRSADMLSIDWSSIVGMATLAWVVLIMGCYVLFAGSHVFAWKYLTPHPEMQSFMMGSAALGFFSTFLGMYLWNKGSTRLPVSFAGQLTIFETIFGLIFVFLVDQQFPTWAELCGATLMLTGVVASINNFKKTQAQQEVHN